MPPAYKLLYFDGRGRAEISRLVFAAAGQKYEDVRYNQTSWPEFKKKTPTGQLPCLEVDGKMYSQSIPIAVYLATTFGLHGTNALECLQVNMIVETANDFGVSVAKSMFEKDETKKAKMQAEVKEGIPKFLENLEKLIGAKYYCLGKLTLADLMVYNVLEVVTQMDDKALEKSPKVQANFNMVKSNERIKKWVETRPQTKF